MTTQKLGRLPNVWPATLWLHFFNTFLNKMKYHWPKVSVWPPLKRVVCWVGYPFFKNWRQILYKVLVRLSTLKKGSVLGRQPFLKCRWPSLPTGGLQLSSCVFNVAATAYMDTSTALLQLILLGLVAVSQLNFQDRVSQLGLMDGTKRRPEDFQQIISSYQALKV